MFLGPGGRCSKGPAVASSSHRSDYQYNLDDIRGLFLSAGSSSHPGALRPFVLPRALLQHGHVLLRSRQVNIHRACCARRGLFGLVDQREITCWIFVLRNESYLVRRYPIAANKRVCSETDRYAAVIPALYRSVYPLPYKFLRGIYLRLRYQALIDITLRLYFWQRGCQKYKRSALRCFRARGDSTTL